MTRYPVERTTRKYIKGYEFLSFARKYKRQLLDTGQNDSKKLVHKRSEFIGNKIAGTNDDSIEKEESAEKIIIPLEKRGNIKQAEKSIIKIEHYNISKLLYDFTLSKFEAKRMGPSK